MKEQPLLTVVVPTLNRKDIAEVTVRALCEEIEGLDGEVELLVVDNASDDGTAEHLQEKFANAAVRVLHHTKRADIDGSFLRCVESSRGVYINIFGDDDLPLPGYLTALLKTIRARDDIGLVYFNRLIADERLSQFVGIAHPNLGIGTIEYDVSDFIRAFTHWPGFITAITFHRTCWIAGDWAYRDDFIGYKFLARIYGGLQEKRAVYIGLPMVIQRRGIQSWKSEWPRYWLVSMPKMLQFLEESGTTHGALSVWLAREVTLIRLIIDCAVASAFGYSRSDGFWDEAAGFHGFWRRVWIRMVQYLSPRVVIRTLYFRFGKYQARD